MQIRPAKPDDAHAIAQVRARAWRATYRGLMPDLVLDSLDTQRDGERLGWILETPPPQTATFVLTSGEAIAGFGRCGPPRGAVGEASSEIYAINIAVGPAKRAGGGAALMHAMGMALAESGFQSAGLWVIERNSPAVSFYAALAGSVAGERQSAEDDALAELLFVWRNIDVLIQNSRALAMRKGWRSD